MSPGEVAGSVGWEAVVAVLIAILTSVFGYGASNQRSKQTENELEDLKKDHSARIKEAKDSADQVGRALVEYREAARDKFVLADDMTRLEGRLAEQIKSSHAATAAKVEELRVEFGKKSIDHTITNAIQKGLAQAIIEAKRAGGDR